MRGVPSLSKIRDVFMFCVYISEFWSFVVTPFVYLLQSNTLLSDSFSSDEGLKKKGGRRSHFHSPHSAMKGGSALLSPSTQGGTTINLLHKATVVEELERMLFTRYARRTTKNVWKTSYALKD